jgi:tetratricopeptide (TPR) repeat protein
MKHLWFGFLLLILSIAVIASDSSTDEIEQLHQQAKKAFFAADYDTALAKWTIALKQARAIDNQTDISKFLVNLGTVHYNLGEYLKALSYYQQAVVIDRDRGDKQGESTVLGYLGQVAHLLGKHQMAVDFHQQALKIQQQLGDKVGQAHTLNNLGMVYDSLSQYQTALVHYEQSLAIHKAQGDTANIANNLSYQGATYKNLSSYQEALTQFEQALKIQKELGNQSAIAKNLTNIGTVYDSLGQYTKALTYYQQALPIQQTISDVSAMSKNFVNLGVTYDNLGQHANALKYYQQALQIQRDLGDNHEIAKTLSNFGIVHKNLGNFQSALTHYKQALAMQTDLGDHSGEANTLTNLGVVYDQLGQYPKALTYYEKALDIQKRIGDKQRIANNLSNLGVVYYHLGQAENAMGYFLNALTIRREIGDKRGEGIDLSNLGAAYDSQRLHSKALKTYLQALEIKGDLGDKRGEQIDLSLIGAVYATQEKYQQALTHFQLALVIAREIGDQLGAAIDLSNLGLVQQKLGHHQEARVALRNSMGKLEVLGSTHLWYAQRGLATIETHFHEMDLAILYYQQSIDNIEKIREGFTEKAHKLSFMQDKMFVYDEFIALLQQLHEQHPNKGHDRKALEIFERKQGRVFLEDIGKIGAQRFAHLPTTVTDQEQKLIQQVAQTQTDLVQARNKPFLEQDKGVIKTLTQRLTSLEVEQNTLQVDIKENYPEYYALKYPQPATVATLQSLLQPGEWMLIYNVMAENTALWMLGPQQFALFTLPAGEEQLYEDIAYLRDVILNRLPELVDEGYPLYQKLFPESARKLLSNAQTLYIVPTGPLYFLPFEALVTKETDYENPDYLVQDHAVVYLSSASLLKVLRDTKARRKVQPSQQFLAFANPTYPLCDSNEGNKTKGRASVDERRNKAYRDIMGMVCFPRLPDTEDEAYAIANLFQGSDNALYLGEKANRTMVLDLNQVKQLSDYRYLLFAVHGLLPYEIEGLVQSSLVLSNEQTIEYLTMADAFTLQLNADFINLSACNTGGGRQIKGEGIMGLTRAFMYAGTPAISVTLWSVESTSAEDLSIGIFKNFKDGKNPAEALRQIKLKMIAGQANKDYYNHPFYWAPFVIYGDGRE